MCGRYCIAASPGELAERYCAEIPQDYQPNYNIAPGRKILQITKYETTRSFCMASWGFHSWTGDLIVNARIESIYEKNLFKSLITKSRCIIPASGYYEWRTEGRQKHPYYITSVNGEILSFAGILRNQSPDCEVVIITTQASPLLSDIHSRMPIIIEKNKEDTFLLEGKISSHTDDTIQAYPVSPRVNSPNQNDAELIIPWKSGSTQVTLWNTFQ